MAELLFRRRSVILREREREGGREREREGGRGVINILSLQLKLQWLGMGIGRGWWSEERVPEVASLDIASFGRLD